MVTAMKEGSRRIIAAVDEAGHVLGLRPGQTVAHAQALVPGLVIVPARPEADAAALARLAAWCLSYAPIVAPDRGAWRERLWGSRGRCWTASSMSPAGCFGAPERDVMPGRRSGRTKPT
jgi:hypothetical protein